MPQEGALEFSSVIKGKDGRPELASLCEKELRQEDCLFCLGFWWEGGNLVAFAGSDSLEVENQSQ